jgi:ribonucleoside-diphosphate reductase alpha chain
MYTLEDLKVNGEAPEWMTLESLTTLREKNYLLPNETPKDMFHRVSDSSAKYLKKPELAAKFFKYMWNNWLCLASPVAANMGTERGLPVSCYGLVVPDSIAGILDKLKEVGMLTKHGGGVGIYLGNLRSGGKSISGGGTTDGLIPFMRMFESVLSGVSQGGVRRGAGAIYDIIRPDEIYESLHIRMNTGGDMSRKCISPSFNHAFCLDDDFMDACKTNQKYRQIWHDLLTVRSKEGQPYLMWTGNANRNRPQCYKDQGLDIKSSQLCAEIMEHSNEEETYTCCLSSLNIARWDEWKDTDLVETAIWFLDGVTEEFIQKAKNIPGFECSVRSAVKGRPLGLGWLGWHSLLQSKMIPFESFAAMQLNAEIAKTLYERSLKASQDLAAEYGEPEYCRGYGIRNTHRLAIAPTKTNAAISGGVSEGIQPIVGNAFAFKGAGGTFIRKNTHLQQLLASKGKDTLETWEQIINRKGSVAGLLFLDDTEKAVFSTFREISMFAVVKQAAQRQRWTCQGQSLNFAFPAVENVTDERDRIRLGRYIHDAHKLAYDLGLNSVYYQKSTSVLAGDKVFRDDADCLSCDG